MEQNKNTISCLLCCEDSDIIGLGQCNHKEFCHRCIYKLRELKQSNTCPICNAQNERIIITDDLVKDFADYNYLDDMVCWDQKWQIFCDSKRTQVAMNSLKLISCFVPNCQENQRFQSINFLKKHLKDRHKKYFCDLCAENKLCLLSEQTLYSHEQLQKHLKYGDHDENGICFLHPYCQFCNEHFFDEEKFYKHLQEKHMACQVCGQSQKFRYYNEYKNLETHYKMSHFICDDQKCQEKGFIAFATSAEKELHIQQVHTHGVNTADNDDDVNFGGKKKKKAQVNLNSLANFSYEGDQDRRNPYRNNRNKKEEQIKDREGVDMEMQFLSQRRIKHKEATITTHEDLPLDLRDFYNHKYDEEARAEEQQFFDLLLGYEGRGDGGFGNYRGRGRGRGRGGRGRGGYNGRGQKIVEKSDELRKKQPYLEDIKILKPSQIYNWDSQRFDNLVEQILTDDDDLNKYYDEKDKLLRKKNSSKQFCDAFFRILGDNAAIRLLPLFIRTIDPKRYQLINSLDSIYMEKVRGLPKQYSDFMKRIIKEMEENIKIRIENKKLDLKIPYKMEKSRILQFSEILKRVSTQDMTHIKYGSNFGISVDTLNLMTKKIYFCNPKNIQKYMEQIEDNVEFLYLYQYFSFCIDILEGYKQEKKTVSTILLYNYLQKNPEHLQIYKKHHGDSKDHLVILKTNTQKGHHNQQYSNKTYDDIQDNHQMVEYEVEESKDDFDTKNKFEFPNIVRKDSFEQKKEEEKKIIMQKKVIDSTGNNKWNAGEGIDKNQEEDVELFPSLGGVKQEMVKDLSNKSKQKKMKEKEVDEKLKQKLEDEKLNGMSLEEQIYGKDRYKNLGRKKLLESDSDEEKESNLRKMGAIKVQKNKKGKQKILLAGGFR
ncbi:hypothetical protein PPERSA_05216 [Pseudocohnilembus persalinus]|uniref:RING-type domain-containing protein n=1 Tax=Pseudocohnilembus persalinus TaxID=266149 RepID=A0A0V0R9F0_PSEPJ|nr:hypothetical protein PPERSA_05216 [Pseudocohnilembus persalinus]|eukprot:KRX11107.1 hypothetical protein PPERSA_05216 [Pseudocohnilembus persalinus]